MSYMHILNTYKDQTILLFRECYALEKLHGTSAHVSWNVHSVGFFAGGESHEKFKALFDEAALVIAFKALGHEKVMVYGEAYGGKQQGQSWRYGKSLKFAAFEVRIGEHWLSVPSAADVCQKLGIEFVHYVKVSTDLEALNAERDAPSVQAKRNGIEGDQPREGVVLRPLIEFTRNDGDRVISKHKRDEERETKSTRQVVDPEKLEVLTRAGEIADEWVTPTRLQHVLQKLPQGVGMEATRDVIAAMVEDVVREGAGEIADSKEARVAIGKKTAELFKAHLKSALKERE
jgi:hypothetical protein